MSTDWSTISSLATAGGTLVLGVATFASVRSANRAARAAERSLLAGLRPVLFPTRAEDPSEKVMWLGQHFAHVDGGRGSVEVVDDVVYLAITLRNVGSGIGVIHGWRPWPEQRTSGDDRPEVSDFRRQSRDLYIPPGGQSFWQGAIREADDPDRPGMTAAICNRTPITIDLLYGDLEGGQRTITRFSLTPVANGAWLSAVGVHWHLDRQAPR